MSLTRRSFLRQGTLGLAGLGAGRLLAVEPAARPRLRIGLMTDLHYADKPPGGTRHYRDALAKLDEAVACMNRERPDFVVELGDLIDQAPSVEQELEWLREIERHYAALVVPRHYVLGNHCVATLTKAEFAAHTGAREQAHYSFDHGGLHFVVLDSCYREDGEPYGRNNARWTDANIPPAQLDWLRADLARAAAPVIVFAHQRLDEKGRYSVRNAATVRDALKNSGHVLAVFQGHSHENDCQRIDGIPYVTLVAQVEGAGRENSGYALLDVMPDHSLRLHGFRRQESRQLATD